MIEVELKFKLDTHVCQQLQARLDTMSSMRCITHIKNVDMYYDTTSFDLLQQAVFSRVRNHAYWEFKFNEQAEVAHIQSTERVFPLKPGRQQMQEFNNLFSHFLPRWCPGATVKQAIHKNGLTILAHIENKRVQYACGDLILSLDRVEGLGSFFEIETLCEEGTRTNQAIARLQRFISDLALPSLHPIHVGYVELWLRLHHPQVYLLGKYQVEDEPEQTHILQYSNV